MMHSLFHNSFKALICLVLLCNINLSAQKTKLANRPNFEAIYLDS